MFSNFEENDSVEVIDSSLREFKCMGYIKEILLRGYLVRIMGSDIILERHQIKLINKRRK